MTILTAVALGLIAVLIAVLPINKRIKHSIVHVLLTAFFCCLSWGMYMLAQEQDALWEAAEFWQPTEVTILNASHETKERRKKDRTHITHRFKVHYQYTVDAHTYESTRYTLGSYNSSQESVDQLVTYYRDKTLTHTGLYDPNDQKKSTLVRGDQSPKGFLLLFSILPGMAGAFLLYRLIRNTCDFLMGKQLASPEA